MVSSLDWPEYLASFHDQRAGITEDVLVHARDSEGRTPYAWAAQAVPPGAVVLDLACGSGPMAAHLGPAYLGVDASFAELTVARASALPVAQASATQLPLAAGSVDAVVSSLALMLLPLAPTLAEVRRVLRPGGVFVATVPHHRPLGLKDSWRYARLFAALRQPGLSYPNDGALVDPGRALLAADLHLVEDESRAFACQLADQTAADRLLDSLYLPDLAPERRAAARRVVRHWAGTAITTPVRRLIASG